MASQLSSNWSDRPAPGALALVQDFLNAPQAEPTADELLIASTIRAEADAGEPQASIAARYDVSQQLVSAILRNKRAAISDRGSNVPAPTLGTPASASKWLANRGFETGRLSAAAYRRLLRLRDVLLALSFANNGHGLAEAPWRELDQIAAACFLRVTFDAKGPRLVPVRPGPASFEATIVAAVYEAMRDGTWPRLKACPADRCHYVFYDTSRNRTSTWCSMAICGNRTKVRNYQERARAARGARTARA